MVTKHSYSELKNTKDMKNMKLESLNCGGGMLALICLFKDFCSFIWGGGRGLRYCMFGKLSPPVLDAVQLERRLLIMSLHSDICDV